MDSQSRDLNGRAVSQNGTLPILPKRYLKLLIFFLISRTHTQKKVEKNECLITERVAS